MLNKVAHLRLHDKEVFLIGTAHVSKESVELVRETLDREKPDLVAVELCEQRHHALSDKKRWSETSISKVIREGRGYLFLIQILLSNFQRKVGDELGVKPGSEMIEAMEIAKERRIPIALVDRDIKVTLKRAIARMSFFEKGKVLFGVFSSIFGEDEKITEEMISQLKETDTLTELMEEFGREIPSVKEVLLDERNQYIADKIIQAPGSRVVAVVGAGHVEGIKKLLESKEQHQDKIRKEISELESMPEDRSFLKVAFQYGFPLTLIILLLSGFYFKGGDFLIVSLIRWSLITGICSAIGASLALAHPVSILTAFVMAPFTTLHPLLAAGWFAGLAEVKFRKPKVKDFEGLMRINSIQDLWTNGVTRVLLVIAFVNVGASIGAFIAGFSIFAGVIPNLF